MNRRQFTVSSIALAAMVGAPAHTLGRQATPADPGGDFPALDVIMSDDEIEVAETVPTGFVMLTVHNTGTNPGLHWLMARFPDWATDADIEAFFISEGEDSPINFDLDLEFVGVPDWPAPGGSAAGIVYLEAGSYLLLDVFGGRGFARTSAEGDPVATIEPAADAIVTLKDMTIDISEEAFTSSPRRWRIDNIGTVPHDVAVVPVTPDLTEEDLLWLLSLPDDATPTPDGPWIDYQPVEAIGVLRAGATSWLDVTLAPGRYVAICMLPFGTGYPHAMDGMFVFFDAA